MIEEKNKVTYSYKNGHMFKVEDLGPVFNQLATVNSATDYCTCNGISNKNNTITNIIQPTLKLPIAKYSGNFITIGKDNSLTSIYIKSVKYHGPATIVFWSDGSKSVARCADNDVYDQEKGIIIAIMKRLYGSNTINNLLTQWVHEANKDGITLTEVRKNQRKQGK